MRLALFLVRSLSFTALSAAAFVACGGDTRDEGCPAGWQRDDQARGGCSPPAERLASGTGVIGFTRVVTGVCGLCDERCSCETSFLAGADVTVYAAGPEGAPHFADDRNCELASSAVPVTSARTDAEGVFQLTLSPGSYFVSAVDPETGCDRRDPVEVGAGMTVVGMIFDHGVY